MTVDSSPAQIAFLVAQSVILGYLTDTFSDSVLDSRVDEFNNFTLDTNISEEGDITTTRYLYAAG